tara:strand:+ start:2670 stop:2846 length:177 start_codon:yes stop_codon:yes gene_type:complete
LPSWWRAEARNGNQVLKRMCADDETQGMIIGIEDGWFSHDRSGHLQWSQLGRQRAFVF